MAWAEKVKGASPNWIFTPRSEFLVALIFFISGVAIISYTEYRFENHDPRRDEWITISATLINAQLEERPCFRRRPIFTEPFVLNFDVAYRVNGKDYHTRIGQYCAANRTVANEIIAERVQGGRVRIYVNPLDLGNAVIDLDGPWQLWSGRLFGWLFLLLGVPRVVIVPWKNARLTLSSSKGYLRPLRFFRSLFPLGYKRALNAASRAALRQVPPPERGVWFWKCEVVHTSPPRAFKNRQGKVILEHDLCRILFRMDSSPPLLSVQFTVETDELKKKLLQSWMAKFRAALEKELLRRAYPSAAIKRIGISLHSSEEIRRVGEYDYWK